MRRSKLFKLCIVVSLVIGLTIMNETTFIKAQGNSTFKDVPSNHWAISSIDWGVKQGIVTGDNQGNFNPSKPVSESEFLAMLVRAYPAELQVRQASNGEKWYMPYFDLATDQYLQITGTNSVYQRYQVANVVYTLLKNSYKTDEQSIQFLLDSSLSSGKTAATVAGYLPYEQLTRAEAIAFIQRTKQLYPSIKETIGKSIDYTSGLKNISIGDTESALISKLGNPDRKDTSENAYTWYVYNKDYHQFAMYGVSSDKKIVALYSNARNMWGSSNAVLVGHSMEKMKSSTISKVNLVGYGYYQVNNNGIITNYYVDSLNENSVDGILQYDQAYAGKSSATQETVDTAYDKQIFDLTNVARTKNGIKKPLVWNEKAAKVAYGHSVEMQKNKYMDHTNLKGLSPRDRLVAAGFKNFGNGENIAYGYENAFSVHNGWLNSKGHRDNMLYESFNQLGVGSYNTYFAQNFIMQY